MANGDGERAAGSKTVEEVLKRTHVQVPQGPPQAGGAEGLIIWMAHVADSILPWGQQSRLRDSQLRDFWPTESYLASALGIVCARNAAFNWEVVGPPRTAAHAQEMLLNANWGRGWEEFVVRLSVDLYSQDRGAYIELVRANNSADSPVIGINHLDALRCYPTGVPDTPVAYQDQGGRFHYLKDYEVVHLTEMPAPAEFGLVGPFHHLQYCAVTRLLKAAQILCNVAIYDDEKTGGRFQRAVQLLRGVSAEQVQQALDQDVVIADAKGRRRYMQPLMVSSVDPKAEIGHETIELASLPDKFDRDSMINHYIDNIAMAFLEDRQTFAPLSGGNLGTSAQSMILHLKSRGKGPALFQKLMIHMLNRRGILPRNVEFAFAEPDVQAAKDEWELRELRAKERAARIASTEITPAVARQLALDAGDLSQEIFEGMGGLDLTGDVTVEDVERPEGRGNELEGAKQAEGEPARAGSEDIEDERLDLEEEVKRRALVALGAMRRRIAERARLT